MFFYPARCVGRQVGFGRVYNVREGGGDDDGSSSGDGRAGHCEHTRTNSPSLRQAVMRTAGDGAVTLKAKRQVTGDQAWIIMVLDRALPSGEWRSLEKKGCST